MTRTEQAQREDRVNRRVLEARQHFTLACRAQDLVEARRWHAIWNERGMRAYETYGGGSISDDIADEYPDAMPLDDAEAWYKAALADYQADRLRAQDEAIDEDRAGFEGDWA